MTRRSAWPVLGVLVAAVAYFLAFVPYGFYLEDEGTMLYQIARTHAGQIPYIDFHTGYTPGLFYVNAWLFDAFGVDVIALRVGLAIVNALAAALLFALTRHVAPTAWALVATLVYVAFLPFFGGEFASFNIPYPSWYVTLLWILSTLLLLRYRETDNRLHLLLAGVAAGGCFCFKPNGGAFALAAGGLGLLVLRSGESLALQRLAACTCAAFGLAVAAQFGFSLLSFETAIFTLPWLALGVGLARREAAPGRGTVWPVIGEGAVLAAGFALSTLPWLVWLKLKMPTGEFLREVLLIGGDVQQVYAIPYPLPEWWALALAVGLVGLGVVPLALGRGLGTRRGVAWSGAIVGAVAAIAFVLFARMPEGLVLSIIWQLENAAFYLVPLALGAAVWWLVRAKGPETGAAALVIVSGLAMLEQMNPRPDFMHLVMGVPVGVAVVAFVGARVAAEWRRLGGVGRGVGAALLLIPFAVGVFRVGSNLGRPVGMDRVTGAVAFGVEASVGQDLASLARVVEFISARTKPDDPVFGFPAMAAVNFLTGRPNPVRHDYFFPGRPAHSEEARVVAELAAVRPAYVVTLNDRFGFFQEAPTYYFLLRDYLRRAYVPELRAGRYDVLRRRDLPVAPAPPAATAPDAVAAAAGLADLDALARAGSVENVPRLLEALRRVHRSLRARVTEAIMAVAERSGGLLPMIRRVDPAERDELMLVRSLGEFGDTRALDYLTARFAEQPTRRMRSETGRALAFVTARLLAVPHVLTGKPPAEGPLPLTVPAETLVAWLEDTKLRRRVGAYAAIVLGRTGHREAVPLLRSLLAERKEGWLQASVARALVDLDAPDAPCDLATLLASPQLAVQTHVPSMLLELGARRPADVRGCLAAALADEEEPLRRESVAWVAGVLRDQALVVPLARLASAEDGPARLAALWALGEIGDTRGAPAVTAALGSDDAIVRDFAGEAERKLVRSAAPAARAGG
jgi:HEAT repeat protein